MSNDLTVLDDFCTALEQTAATELVAAHQLPILKLSRSGQWEYGKESIGVDDASYWAWVPTSMQHGWVSWGDGGREGEIMVPITQKSPPQEDLPQTAGGAWQRQYSVQLSGVKGPDTGELVQYIGTSSGLIDVFGKMTKAIIQQIRGNRPMIPLIKLGTTHYVHKKYGKIYKPDISVVGWVHQEDDPAEALHDFP